jgi:hypothetical protein
VPKDGILIEMRSGADVGEVRRKALQQLLAVFLEPHLKNILHDAPLRHPIGYHDLAFQRGSSFFFLMAVSWKLK